MWKSSWFTRDKIIAIAKDTIVLAITKSESQTENTVRNNNSDHPSNQEEVIPCTKQKAWWFIDLINDHRLNIRYIISSSHNNIRTDLWSFISSSKFRRAIEKNPVQLQQSLAESSKLINTITRIHNTLYTTCSIDHLLTTQERLSKEEKLLNAHDSNKNGTICRNRNSPSSNNLCRRKTKAWKIYSIKRTLRKHETNHSLYLCLVPLAKDNCCCLSVVRSIGSEKKQDSKTEQNVKGKIKVK